MAEKNCFDEKVYLENVVGLSENLLTRLTRLQRHFVGMIFCTYWAGDYSDVTLSRPYELSFKLYEEAMRREGVPEALNTCWIYSVLDIAGVIPNIVGVMCPEFAEEYGASESYEGMEDCQALEDSILSGELGDGYNVLLDMASAFHLNKDMPMGDVLRFVFPGLSGDFISENCLVFRLPKWLIEGHEESDIFIESPYWETNYDGNGNVWIMTSFPFVSEPDGWLYHGWEDRCLPDIVMIFQPKFIVEVAKRMLKEKQKQKTA